MALQRIRRVGISLLTLCALPIILPLPWGTMMELVIDAVTILMALTVCRAMLELVANSWTTTWHT